MSDNISAASLCWREGWISSGESLWSLLHKFALLNSVDLSGIKDFLSIGVKQHTNLRWRRRDDLRYLGILDPLRLAVAFRVDEKLINESLVSTYLKPHEVDILSSDKLRFCPVCLKEGFHSPIYQLLFFNKCPAHDISLTTDCTTCGGEIPYQLSVACFKKPYRCPNCHELLSQPLASTNLILNRFPSRDEAFKSIKDWLMHRLSLKTVEASLVRTNLIIVFFRKKSGF